MPLTSRVLVRGRFHVVFAVLLLLCVALLFWWQQDSGPGFASSDQKRLSDRTAVEFAPQASNARWAYLSDASIDSSATEGMEWQIVGGEGDPAASQRRILHADSALILAGLHWHDLPQTATATACSKFESKPADVEKSICPKGSDCLRPGADRGQWFSNEPVLATNAWARWFAKPQPSLAQLKRTEADYCYQLLSRPLILSDAQGRAALDILSPTVADKIDWLGDGIQRALGPLHYPWSDMLITDQEPGRSDWLAFIDVDWMPDAEHQRAAAGRAVHQQRVLNQRARGLWQLHGGGDALLWRIDKRQPHWPLALQSELPLQWVFERDTELTELRHDGGRYHSALAFAAAPVQALLPALDRPAQLKQWLDRLMAYGFDGFVLRPDSLAMPAWPALRHYSNQVLNALQGATAVADVFILGDVPGPDISSALAEQGLSWLHIGSSDYQHIQTDPMGYRLADVRARSLLIYQSVSEAGEEARGVRDWAEEQGHIVWRYAPDTEAVSNALTGSAIQNLIDESEWAAWLSSMARDFRFRFRQPVPEMALAKWESATALLVWVSNEGNEPRVLSLDASAKQLAVLEPASGQWMALKALRGRWEVPLAAGESRWLSFNYQAEDLPSKRRLQPVFETIISVPDADFVNGSFETELEIPASWEASDQGFSLQLSEIGGGVAVMVNGEDCGRIDFAPKRLELSDCVQPGVNNLLIKMRPPLAAGSELQFLQHF